MLSFFLHRYASSSNVPINRQNDGGHIRSLLFMLVCFFFMFRSFPSSFIILLPSIHFRMALPFEDIKNINDSKDLWKIVVRVKDLWYKLEVHIVDGKHIAKFIFWDSDCAKLIGKSVINLKTELVKAGEDDPLEFPYPLDSILNKELAIRVVYQPNKCGRLSVVGFRNGEKSTKELRDQFPTKEHTSKLNPDESSTHDDDAVDSESMFACANLGLTPLKRSADESLYDGENVQLSYTKLLKDVKKEK
ncbi:hypothetical protein KIW84_062146 [Lathyrus oleraceus]|uniref:Uncharacterized protein n=1 Tax=Pisum sativum TaxID=3888 RepID=A0A9D4W5N9_PEA|nr:hypothetical protein KIW84_062146 [Pisum sativum]